MTSILEQQATKLLTIYLGRAPTAEEIRLSTISPQTLANIHNSLAVGQSILTIQPTDDIQEAIDKLVLNGGGILNLDPIGVYTPTSNINLYSNITLNGQGATIDFGGGPYQVLVQGTDPYSVGTVSTTFGSGTVTGSGTTWTDGMIGQSILIGDYWYSITGRTSNTSITIDPAFQGTNLSGDTYVIATTVNGPGISSLTLTNSSTTLLRFRYVNSMILDALLLSFGAQGLDGDDSGNVLWLDNSTVDQCSIGMTFDNVPFCVFDAGLVSNISGGTAIALNRVSNTAISSLSIQAINGVGMSFKNCYDLGLINFAFIGIGSHGIEYISGNSSMNASEGYVDTCGGDGVKFTSGSDGIQVYGNNILNTIGYQINVADASSSNNIISLNVLDGSGAGAMNDLGTGTLIRSNIGTPDN